MKKKMSLPLKVFLIVLAVGILYVLIRSVIRVSTGEIEISMAVGRFIIGSLTGVLVAGIAAGITSLVVSKKKKQKLNLPLLVFLIVAVAGILYIIIRSIMRVSAGEITSDMVMGRLFLGSVIYSLVPAGIAAGITALVLAIKKLGE